MNYSIMPFPVLSNDLFKRLGLTVDEYKSYYIEDGVRRHLKVDTDDVNGITVPTLKISDDENQWHPDTHNFYIERTLNLRFPSFLYGPSGIASEDSELGIAWMWFSRDSNQRGVFESHPLPNLSSPHEVKFRSYVAPGQLKGLVNFQFVIFLNRKSLDADSPFATKEGTIIGILDESKLILDGRGSEFPIVEVEEPDMPLWFVRCRWTDPLEDAFIEENVVVCINKSNSRYEALNMADGLKKSYYLQEIIASAMQTIVIKALESESRDVIISGQGDIADGSIAQAVHYFISTFDWDTSSPDLLAQSIRKDFESRF